MSICVICPMHGFGDMTKKCIDYTLKNAGVELDILVVDDGSPDPFSDDRVSVLRLDKNVGFTGATNAGIMWALERKYEYVLFLNNDTEPEPDFAKLLLEALEKDPEIGIAGSARIIYGEKEQAFIENFGIDLVSGYQAYTKEDLDKPIVYVAWLPICSALMSTETIRYVGLLDKRMRIYCSDNDYCIRAQQLGYRIALVPKSKIKHFHQHTTRFLKTWDDATKDQKVLLEKLSCQLQIKLLDTYPLSWSDKSWGKLEFFVYTKDKEPYFVEDDKSVKPSTT